MKHLLAAAALVACCSVADAVTLVDGQTAAHTAIAIFSDPRVTGDDVGRMGVEVTDGVVTLRGRVATPEARQEAEAVALRVPGVKAVRNELAVERAPVETAPDDALSPRLRRLLSQDPHLRRARIRGRVADGFVTLEGRVADVEARAIASRLARALVGVKAVRNELWAQDLGLGSVSSSPWREPRAVACARSCSTRATRWFA
jgi:hyperosmotically inducible periplasmic protein